MERLREYCSEVCNISGVETYIIAEELYDEFISDSELLSQLSFSANGIRPYIDYAKSVSAPVHFAVTHFHGRIKPFEWIPVNCIEYGDSYFHVSIRNTWLCRECGKIHCGTIIMPMREHDPVFYPDAPDRQPPIPPVFEKISCSDCGKPLQNHLIFLW